MTYPQVTVNGENLPDPPGHWDDRSYSTGEEAVYYPSRFKFQPNGGDFLFFVWESDENEERMWIHTDNIDDVHLTHDHLE